MKTTEQIAADCGLSTEQEAAMERALFWEHGHVSDLYRFVICALYRRIKKLEEVVDELHERAARLR